MKTEAKFLKRTIRGCTRIAFALGVGMVIGHSIQPVQAGWSGSMNGTGYGWASSNVRAGYTGASNSKSSGNTQDPSSYMPGGLPSGASYYTYANVSGRSGYIWSASTQGYNGDSTDNAAVESRVTILPYPCPKLTMSSVFAGQNIEVTAKGSAGTGMLLRLYTYDGSAGPVPADDPNTVPNECVDFLKLYGVLKFDYLAVGPFEFGGAGCPLIIPVGDANPETQYFLSDAASKSTPLEIQCAYPPNSGTFQCVKDVTYPDVTYVNGCETYTAQYSPPAALLTPGTHTINVTVTSGEEPPLPLTDPDGNPIPPRPYDERVIARCSFTVTIADTIDPTITAPANLTDVPTDAGKCYATGVNLGTPTTADNCGVATVANDAPAQFPKGTTTVTWTVTDSSGNKATATQTVTVKDLQPPAAPTLPDVIGQCGIPVTLTAPTTTDNCDGTVTGTTSNSLVYNAAGTYTVVWTFRDAAGNFSTANQKVIVNGLGLVGFYSPIGTQGNQCVSTTVTANKGSNTPIKFDIKCGTSFVTAGISPIIRIEEFNKTCNAVLDNNNIPKVVTSPAVFQNDWHANFDTSVCTKGFKYRISVNVNGAELGHVWIKIN